MVLGLVVAVIGLRAYQAEDLITADTDLSFTQAEGLTFNLVSVLGLDSRQRPFNLAALDGDP